MNEVKKTSVGFECTQKQRDSYIKAAGGKKLGVWIQSVLDAAVKQQATGANKVKPKPKKMVVNLQEDDGDSIGNR